MACLVGLKLAVRSVLCGCVCVCVCVYVVCVCVCVWCVCVCGEVSDQLGWEGRKFGVLTTLV